jgi:ADP-heptose:LPS heptosyltransferase
MQLLDRIMETYLWIGNDSGPSQLAGIIGTPTVCVFGATDSAVWRPLGPQVHAIQGGSLESISVDYVLNAAEHVLRQSRP